MNTLLRLIVRHGLILTGIGVIAALFSAFALTRFLASLLFGVAASDPAVFATLSILLLVVAFLACYLPARRAARLDPMRALSRT